MSNVHRRWSFPTGLIVFGMLWPLMSSQQYRDVRFREKDNRAMWVKDITRRRDRVTLTCPMGTVIYGPQFLVGARADQNEATGRTVSERDCRGLAQNALTQMNKCYWKPICMFKWRERMPIVASTNTSCVGVIPDYVIVNNPLCIPVDNVITMCEEEEVIEMDFGVIRSHDAFPWSLPRSNLVPACRKILTPKSNHTLSLYVEDFNISPTDTLTIYHVTMSGTRTLRGEENQRDVLFSVTSGRIIIDYVIGALQSDGEVSGFVIKFEQKACRFQDDDLTIGETAQKFASFGLSQFTVRATVSRCLSNNKESMTLACPDDHVIFQPELRHGVAGWERRCHGKDGDCRGMTHTLLVQKNQCHWRPECQFSWRTKVPMIVTDRLMCMARSPDYVELKAAQCLPRDSVYDICSRDFWNIKITHGYLRSHADYPWNYEEAPRICRKRICVHRQFGLRISSDNLDLTPNEAGDHVKIWRVTELNERHLMKVYHRNERIEECFSTGCVDVEFKKKKGMTRGKGFVFQISTIRPVRDNSTDFYHCGSIVDAVRKHRQRMAAKRLQRSAAIPSWSCDKKEKYVHTTTAKDLEKKLKIGCKKGQVLTSISLVGHNGSCKGLTPDLFVQMNKCYWERHCTFNYDTTAANYMLKLFEGDSSDCVVKQPDTFTFSYECTHKKAPLFELFTTDGEMNATVKGGIIRSHSYHPWLYKRKDTLKALTLFRPIPHKKYKHFVFTIRSLNLVSGDSLTISTGSKGEETKVTLNDTDAVALNESKTHVITDVKDDAVTVSLSTSHNTNGSEGFVLCFRWMRWKPKYKNKVAIACQKQLLPKKCKPKKG